MKDEAYNHAKLMDCAEELGISMAHMRGILISIWWETKEHYPQGDIGRYSNNSILRAIGELRPPEGTRQLEADELVGALVRFGLLDEMDPPSRLYVHDWHEHCEDYVHTKLAKARKLFANGVEPHPSRMAIRDRPSSEEYDRSQCAQGAHQERNESAQNAATIPGHTTPSHTQGARPTGAAPGRRGALTKHAATACAPSGVAPDGSQRSSQPTATGNSRNGAENGTNPRTPTDEHTDNQYTEYFPTLAECRADEQSRTKHGMLKAAIRSGWKDIVLKQESWDGLSPFHEYDCLDDMRKIANLNEAHESRFQKLHKIYWPQEKAEREAYDARVAALNGEDG